MDEPQKEINKNTENHSADDCHDLSEKSEQDIIKSIEQDGSFGTCLPQEDSNLPHDDPNLPHEELKQVQSDDLFSFQDETSFICPECKEDRLSLIQCMYCGDRLVDTTMVTPYQRLLLKPCPLYNDQVIQAAKERLLVIFHPLKASRLNAHWSLKQRTLICRDANTLQKLSGSLITYTKYLQMLKSRFETKLDTLDPHKPLKELLDSNQSISWAINQSKTPEHAGFNPELYLVQSAYDELKEYDSYQERERLFNQSMRLILDQARKIANQLYRYNMLEPTLDLDALMPKLFRLQQLESWLEGQRQQLSLKVKHDVAL